MEKSSHDDEAESLCLGTFSKKHPNVTSFISTFFTESTMHGVKYIASPKLTVCERIFWGLAVSACIGYSIHLTWDVVRKYYGNSVIISFQPQETTIGEIPFPAITICNVNLLKASVLNKLFEDLKTILDNATGGSHQVEVSEMPPDVQEKLIRRVIEMDRLAQFCLAAPSFKRRTGMEIKDAQGLPDFIHVIQQNLSSINDSFDGIKKAYDKKFDISDTIFRNAAIDCQDMILSCLWSGVPINCMDHFAPLDTRNGRCCVFNMLPSYILQNISTNETRAKNERKHLTDNAIKQWTQFANEGKIFGKRFTKRNVTYPKFQKAGGKPYGLSVLLNPDLNEYSSCTVSDSQGFKIVAHTPFSSPSIMDFGAAVPANSEVFVNIEPHVTMADEKMLEKFEPKIRGCYIPNDDKAKLEHYIFYSSENCLMECIAELTEKNCHCVTHFMPRNPNQIICDAKMHECVNKVRSEISVRVDQKAYCGKCLPPCTEIKHKLQMSQFDIRKYDEISYFTYNSSDGVLKNATNYTILHMFYGTDTTYAKERKALYDGSDLIANAGGFLSLTLGISIISLVEVIYFFTIRAGIQFYSVWKQGKNENEVEDDDDQEGGRSFGNNSGTNKNKNPHQNHDKHYSNDWSLRNRANSLRSGDQFRTYKRDGFKQEKLFPVKMTNKYNSYNKPLYPYLS